MDTRTYWVLKHGWDCLKNLGTHLPHAHTLPTHARSAPSGEIPHPVDPRLGIEPGREHSTPGGASKKTIMPLTSVNVNNTEKIVQNTEESIASFRIISK